MKVGIPLSDEGFIADQVTGILSAFMGFIEEGDEVIIFEPFFDQ